MMYIEGDYAKYATFIRDTGRRYGLPEHLLELTLWQASGFDAGKIRGEGQHTTIGVRGIASLTMDDCETLWRGVDRRVSPLDAIIGCARLLKKQHDRFSNWRLALLAYHSSADTVREAIHGRDRIPIDADRYTGQAQAQCRL